MDNVHFILVEPIYAGNVGAVARILNNFGFHNLRIVGTIPSKNDFYLAVHSEHILNNVRIFPSLAEAIRDMDRVIAFSSKLGKTKPVDMMPPMVAQYIHKLPALQIGVVFGRETFGLTDKEADLCPLRCLIPTGSVMPSINLAQAVAIAAWEIFSYPLENRKTIKAVGGKELSDMKDYMIDVLRSIGFFQDFESTNWESFLTKMLHQLNPPKSMHYRFRQMFNRIHVLVTGTGKGYVKHDKDQTG